MSKSRILFTGGGTGGHLYPLIATAQELKKLVPDSEILFMGSKSRIESKAVPNAGFDFRAITVTGFPRKPGFEMLLFPFVFTYSILEALFVLTKFRPAVAVGSGAYISVPGIVASKLLGARVMLLEQNSFPGVSTKLLQRLASEIHVAFPDTIKYFKNRGKVHHTGNPVRPGMMQNEKASAVENYGLSPEHPVLLILGGSLGADKLNETVSQMLPVLKVNGIQVIWQTGERYYSKYKDYESEKCRVMPFISEMGKAYAASTLLVARAGATTIAEIAALGIPAILVPSPNVANNHQYHNAKSLADNGAAALLTDDMIGRDLCSEVISIIKDKTKLSNLSEHIKKFSTPDAGRLIAERIFRLAEGKKN